MKKTLQKILKILFLMSLLTGQLALAQDVPTDTSSVTPPTPPTPDATPPVPPSSTPDLPATTPAPSSGVQDPGTQLPTDNTTSLPSVDLQGTTTSVQDTAGIQTTAPADVLENTASPESATSTATTTPLVVDPASTTTPSQEPVVVLQSTTTSEAIPLPDVPPPHIVAQHVESMKADASLVTREETIRVASLHAVATPLKGETPQEPAYRLSLTGNTLPSKRASEDMSGADVSEETVTTPLVSTVDTQTGTVEVSGQCLARYFVVLLFKHSNDYVDDRRSYIVNRAYPCVNGAFTYGVSQLPETLPSGNYYLLVGEEGSSGAWKPITALTEITITRNQ